MSPTHHRPTARDVAALAGVSVATVSHVMNGHHGHAGEETRRRVLAAAEELAYLGSSSARSLRLRRTERVCLVVGALGIPALDRLAGDIAEAADKAGYGVMTLLVDSTARAQRAVELLHQRVADGAVIGIPTPHLTAELLRPLARSRFPLVVMGNMSEPDGFDVVHNTEVQACSEALDHLFATGRRRVAYLAQEFELEGQPSERLGAYLAALDRHGITRKDRIVIPGADDRVSAYRAVAEQLLRRQDPPDAIFASSDRAAVSTIWALRDAGRVVPADVAVVGVGNLDEGLITKPALTTVGPPAHHYHEVARTLFERVLAKEPYPGKTIMMPWSFIRRESA